MICFLCENEPASVASRLYYVKNRKRRKRIRAFAFIFALMLLVQTILLSCALGMPCRGEEIIKHPESIPFAHSSMPHGAFIGPLSAPDLFEVDVLPKPEPKPEPEPEPTTEEIVEGLLPTNVPTHSVDWYGSYRVKTSYEPVTAISGEEVDDDLREFLVKMTYAESGAMSWWGQVYTCSAIINHVERANVTLWDAGHNINRFAVAPWVDGVEPEPLTYQVVDYVLAGGRIEELTFFRSGGRYHDFGHPICRVDEHYFSIMEKKE
jgi:hypothetical protein